MILFFVRGEVDSDKLIKFCYASYRDIMYDARELPAQQVIVREEGEKPRFLSGDVHFNLSHSHGATVLAMSHAPIGVDIEKVRPVHRDKFPFIEAENDEDFFREWTRRESYVKFTGKGIAGIRGEIPPETHFEQFDVFDGYITSVCAEEQNVIAYEIDPSAIENSQM